MPDYRVFQKDQAVTAVNLKHQDRQDALTSGGYEKVWEVVYADNAEAALLRYQHLRRDEDNAAQSFVTDSVVSNLLSLILR